MNNREQNPAGDGLELPSPASPPELDRRILRYASDHAPARPYARRSPWLTGLAAASVAGIALLLTVPEWSTAPPAARFEDPASADPLVVSRNKAASPQIRELQQPPAPSAAAATKAEASPALAEMDQAVAEAPRQARQFAARHSESVGTSQESGQAAGKAATSVASSRLRLQDVPQQAIDIEQEAAPVSPFDETPGEVPEHLIATLKADMVSRGGSNEAELHLARSVTWRDGSLGCPQPGVAYTQALVEGYQVVFRDEGRSWDYHANIDGGFRLCEKASQTSAGDDEAPEL